MTPTAIAAVAAAAAAAVLVSPAGPPPAARLRSAVPPRGPGARPARPAGDRSAASRALAAVLLGLGVAVIVGGLPGIVAAVGVAVAADRLLGRLEPRAVRLRRQRMAADAPVAADLLAACLLAGSPPANAAAAVADALGGPVGEELRGVVSALRLGADPVLAWAALGGIPPLSQLGRGLARALDSGAPLADSVARLADDQRAALRWAAEEEARKVGVRAAAPLGVCFLPAFVLVGVVPLVAGAAGALVL